jgi:ubiquitin-protein ligase
MMNENKALATLSKRINRDCAECIEAGVEIIKDDKDFKKLTCILYGPHDSDYESGIFKLGVNFTSKYPFEPPEVVFLTKIYHPNISFQSGSICVDILKSPNWSPALSFHKVLLSIQSLLTDANPDSPLNADAASLYRRDRKEYKKKCQKYIQDALEN